MFNLIIKWQIFFIFIDTFQSTIQISTNHTLHFSFGFFCLYCGQTHSYFSSIQSKQIIDCTQPYSIFCSYKEAIGCVKYLKIIDYHINIIKDCLRFTDLSNSNIQCQSQYSQFDINIKEKIFCCNDTSFCNQSFSLIFRRKKCFLIFFILIISFQTNK